MKRIIEAEKEYTRFRGQKAIDKFFKAFPELDYWKEHLEWMLESGTDFDSNNVMADGTKIDDWTYAIHFDDTEDYTYICIIERA